jgi:phosphoribosylglycinamide formyltransferase-1
VDAGTDTGPIAGQEAVAVLPGDNVETLAARVLSAEHRLYPLALELVASGIVKVEGERVIGTMPEEAQEPLFSPCPAKD